jgi:hypothetical protein
MYLLNKNFTNEQAVRIKSCDNESLIGKTGVIMGKDPKPSNSGLGEFYIVVLDVLPLGFQWRALVLHERNLQKIEK